MWVKELWKSCSSGSSSSSLASWARGGGVSGRARSPTLGPDVSKQHWCLLPPSGLFVFQLEPCLNFTQKSHDPFQRLDLSGLGLASGKVLNDCSEDLKLWVLEHLTIICHVFDFFLLERIGTLHNYKRRIRKVLVTWHHNLVHKKSNRSEDTRGYQKRSSFK